MSPKNVNGWRAVALFLLTTWFLAIILLFTVPAAVMLFKSAGCGLECSAEKSEEPTGPGKSAPDGGKAANNEAGNQAGGTQGKAGEGGGYNAPNTPTTPHKETASTPGQGAVVPRKDFGDRYKQVTDTFTATLNLLLAAFIAFAGINGASQVVSNAHRMKNGMAPVPLNILGHEPSDPTPANSLPLTAAPVTTKVTTTTTTEPTQEQKS